MTSSAEKLASSLECAELLTAAGSDSSAAPSPSSSVVSSVGKPHLSRRLSLHHHHHHNYQTAQHHRRSVGSSAAVKRRSARLAFGTSYHENGAVPPPPSRRPQHTAVSSSSSHHQQQQHHHVQQENEEEEEEMVARKRRADNESRLDQPGGISAAVRCRPADRTVLLDPRAFALQLDDQRRLAADERYFEEVQLDVVPEHRRVALSWLLEVAGEQHLDVDVFPLAAHILDRFLSRDAAAICKQQIQALSAAALLIAGKLKSPQPLTVHQVADYTAGAVDLHQLVQWELLVLERLGWEMSAPTAIDIFGQLAARVPAIAPLRRHFVAVLLRAITDHRVGLLPTALQAGVCLLYVARRTVVQPSSGARRRICCSSNGELPLLQVVVAAIQKHLRIAPEECARFDAIVDASYAMGVCSAQRTSAAQSQQQTTVASRSTALPPPEVLLVPQSDSNERLVEAVQPPPSLVTPLPSVSACSGTTSEETPDSGIHSSLCTPDPDGLSPSEQERTLIAASSSSSSSALASPRKSAPATLCASG